MRYLVIILSLIGPNMLMAQEPLGEPNEVWLNYTSGDTAYLGVEACFQIHFANQFALEYVQVEFGISSPDGAEWQWLDQPDGEGHWPDERILTFVEGNRWVDAIDIVGISTMPHPLSGGVKEDTVGIGLVTVGDPPMATGSLEHIINLHIKPTKTGTICVRKTNFYPGDDWQFSPPSIVPSWNGPFYFTVVEPPAGDINCDGIGNIGDAVYLINWIFRGGPEPCR